MMLTTFGASCCRGCSGHERHDDHHCSTEDHEEIHHRWLVAVAWLGFDRGNGRVGSWDGCGLALVTIGALGHSRGQTSPTVRYRRGAMSAFK